MRLSWNEIRPRAAAFARDWANAGYEKGETQSFYNDFFEIFCVHVNVLPTEPFLVIPEVSSERREYVPIGWLEPPTIPSNLTSRVSCLTNLSPPGREFGGSTSDGRRRRSGSDLFGGRLFFRLTKPRHHGRRGPSRRGDNPPPRPSAPPTRQRLLAYRVHAD